MVEESVAISPPVIERLFTSLSCFSVETSSQLVLLAGNISVSVPSASRQRLVKDETSNHGRLFLVSGSGRTQRQNERECVR